MSTTALEKYKKLIEERKEKEKNKKKERIKREKERLREKKKAETHKRMLKKKRDAYKPIHVKNLRKKQNARAYAKIKARVKKEHDSVGDSFGYYRIILAKNRKMTEAITTARWMSNAYERFNTLISDNRKGVICQKKIAQSNLQDNEKIYYEILLLKKIDPNSDDGKRMLRDENGTFVENNIKNRKNYAIIAKDEWYIPETYNVYGYNPISDRKTGRWIFDNIVNQNCCRENIKNIFMCDNKLIIQYGSDMDFVICKNSSECLRLYNALQAELPKSNKFVIFTAYISKQRKTWLYNKLEEKTGWRREMLMKNKG